MRAEAVAGFVVIGRTMDVIMERPRAARLVRQMAYLRRHPWPKPSGAAASTLFAPFRGIDMAVGVKGCDELVASFPAAVGKA